MHSERFNTFYFIHKALRSMMFDAAMSIQRTDFTNNDESEATLEKVKSVVEFLDDHANHEDNFVMPPVEKFSPELIKEFEKEHVTDRRIGSDIDNVLAEIKNAKTDDEKRSSGLKLMYLFYEFIGFNLYHMNKEEDKLNQVLWGNLTDADIMEIQQKIVKSIPHEKNLISLQWMMRSLSNPELVRFLGTLKHSMPPPAFSEVITLAEKNIPSNRWSLIKNEF